MSDKSGITLSITMLVAIVISIAMLIGGLMLLFQFTSGTEQVTELVDEGVEKEFAEQEEVPKEVTEEAEVEEQVEELKEEEMPSEVEEEEAEEKPDCLNDFSCEFYFITVPLGNWPSQEFFEIKAQERMNFFIDISGFKFTRTGSVFVPLDFAANCDVASVNLFRPKDHLKIKNCADLYADSLGIEYEKAVGLSNLFNSGRTFFNGKAVYTSLGYTLSGVEEERPGLVAHELGHGYFLCDEYSYSEYLKENRLLVRNKNSCRNAFPKQCSKTTPECFGNTPVFREYSGDPLFRICQGNIYYSVMGVSTGAECGYDTAGYKAVGGLP